MLGRLKSIYPLNELARIVDLAFSRFDEVVRRLDLLDQRWHQTDAASRTDSEAILARHREIAENDALMLRTVTYAVEALRQLQGTQMQIRQAQDREARFETEVGKALDELNGQLNDVLARTRRREAELLDASRELQSQLARLRDSTGADHARLIEALEERDARMQAAMTALCQQDQQLLAAFEGVGHSLRGAVEQAAEMAVEQHSQAAQAELRSALEQHTQAVAPRISEMQRAIVDRLDQARIHFATTQFDALNPDVRLLEYLYSYLPCTVAVDVGANVGEVSERLLRTGYEVYSFEPYPPVFEELKQRLSDRKGFHPFPLAVGFVDRKMDLHIATDKSPDGRFEGVTTLFSSLVQHSTWDELPFTHKVKVQVRSLESLQKSGELPHDIGLMKIDTEGYDLEVIRGMGACRPPVVMAEFWDPRLILGRAGANNLLEELVSEMRDREYKWYVVIYRIDGRPISYFCNQPLSPPDSWGNVLFFRERALFTEAMQWCSATLPPTYF